MDTSKQPPTVLLLVELDEKTYAVEAIHPKIYHLGIYFALEQLRWEQQSTSDPHLL